MKRVCAVLLVIAMMLAYGTNVLAEVSPDLVCYTIAQNLPDNFEGNETFSAESHYDSESKNIVLEITSKKNDHTFFDAKRAIDDIQPFYDMLLDLNVYSTCKEIMDSYSVEGVDIYFLAYSIDGALEYIEINGKNMTAEFLRLAGTLDVNSTKTPQDIIDAYVEQEKPNSILALGQYQQGEHELLILARVKNMLPYDSLMESDDIDSIIAYNIQLSKDMRDELDSIGETDIMAFSVLYTYDETCVNVAVDGFDATEIYRESAKDWIDISDYGYLTRY